MLGRAEDVWTWGLSTMLWIDGLMVMMLLWNVSTIYYLLELTYARYLMLYRCKIEVFLNSYFWSSGFVTFVTLLARCSRLAASSTLTTCLISMGREQRWLAPITHQSSDFLPLTLLRKLWQLCHRGPARRPPDSSSLSSPLRSGLPPGCFNAQWRCNVRR